MQSGEQNSIVFGIQGHGEQMTGISTNRAAVEALVALCNRENLAAWQLHDVIEDFVQQEAMVD